MEQVLSYLDISQVNNLSLSQSCYTGPRHGYVAYPSTLICCTTKPLLKGDCKVGPLGCKSDMG